jgi:hypothetical protein
MDYQDMPEMRLILRTAAADHYRLKGMVEAVAQSDLFTKNTVPLPNSPQQDRKDGAEDMGPPAKTATAPGAPPTARADRAIAPATITARADAPAAAGE